MRVSAGHNALIESFAGMGSSFDDDGGDGKREEWRTESGGVYVSWNGVVAEREGEEADMLWAAAVGDGSGDGDDGLDEGEVARLEARWAEVE